MSRNILQKPIFSVLFLLVVLAGSNVNLRAQEDFPVTTIGDWVVDAGDPATLAGALQTAISGDTITLDNSLTGPWSWTVLQTEDQIISVLLGGNTMSGAPLDLVTGSGAFTFANGQLGSTTDDFGIGRSGNATATFDTITLQADALQIGSASSSAKTTFTGGTITVDSSFLVQGYGSNIALDGASLTTTGFSLMDGGSLLSDGGSITINGNLLTVSGVGIMEDPLTPGTYLTPTRSTLKGSGSLVFNRKELKVLDGAVVDLSGFSEFAGSGYTVDHDQTLLVDGVFSHASSGQSFGASLTIDGALKLTHTGAGALGKIDITKGGSLSGVTSIAVDGGTTLNVDGAMLDADTGNKHRSELHAGGAMTIGGPQGAGTVLVNGGARIDGLTTITVGNGVGGVGTLKITDMDVPSNQFSNVVSSGMLTVGENAVGTLLIDGGGLLSSGAARIGRGVDGSSVTVSGGGSGAIHSTWNVGGDFYLSDTASAKMDITGGAQANVTGNAFLGNTAGKTATLTLAGRGGTDSADATLKTTGQVIVGNGGNVVLNVNAGGYVQSDQETILGANGTSNVTVTINAPQYQSRSAWLAGGTAVTPGTYTAPLGNSQLEVLAGKVTVSGLFAMAGQNAGYDKTVGNLDYGKAIFRSGAELHMSGGAFYNMNTSNFVDGTSLGLIEFNSGSVVSGSGHIYAGEKFSVNGGTIAAGGRWMYDFDHDRPQHSDTPTYTGNDELTSIGHLHIHDRADTPTEFNSATYRTELDRIGTGTKSGLPASTEPRADRTTVYGELKIDPNFKVDISRALNGKYLLIDTVGGAGDIISSFTPRQLNSITNADKFLNLNGKSLKGNDRIDRAGGMFTTLENGNKEIYLTVNTTSGGNVRTWWTGLESGQKWTMKSRNFDATLGGATGFVGDDQFLDGDIVVFDYSLVPTGTRRTVNVTPDASDFADYSGDFSNTTANVVVNRVEVLGGTLADTFEWRGGSILAIDSALYTTIDRQSGGQSPSGQLAKIGNGVLDIHNANEFYGGVHLGEAGVGGGVINLYNQNGLGHYDSTSGFMYRGAVFVHENSQINVMYADGTSGKYMQNRFIVDEDKVLTIGFDKDFWISKNNATADNAINGGNGGGIYIGDRGQVVYSTTDTSKTMHVTNNIANWGGGIYTEYGYTLKVSTEIAGNVAYLGGGGIYAAKKFDLKDNSNISGNATQGKGGGIYVGLTSDAGSAGSAFSLHGHSEISSNYSGDLLGAAAYVDGGRILNLTTRYSIPTAEEPELFGGDIWIEGNYGVAKFDPDTPNAMPTLDAKSKRSGIHLADTAILNISGPYNTYVYDPLSGDAKATVNINGLLSDVTNTNTADLARMGGNQSGTAIFIGDSAYYGNTKVTGGATFRLENTTDPDYVDAVENPNGAATYGRKGSLATSPSTNIFTVDAASGISGQGTIAADEINLAGKIDLDTGRFSRPGGGKPGDPAPMKDGSGSITAAEAKTQGVLDLDGAITVAGTSQWNLNLTNLGGTAPKSDLINVTGSTTFSGAAGNKLTLGVDDMVRGKYLILTSTGTITTYSKDVRGSDAKVYLNGNMALDYAQTAPLTNASIPELGRLKAATYADTKGNNLYLDIKGRNRLVTASNGGTWDYNDTWTFAGTAPNGANTPGVAWSAHNTGNSAPLLGDNGPATSAYLDGDMVLLTAGTYSLTGKVNPVDLFVENASGTNVTIQGGGGITTFSASAAVSNSTVKGQDASTISTTAATNDYGIRGYTGKLYKSLGNTLIFSNIGGNRFEEGIAFGFTAGNAGTISFNDAAQLVVGVGKTIDFLENGTLLYSATGAGTEVLHTAAAADAGTDIQIVNGKTATFDIATVARKLTVSGQVRGVGAVGTGTTGAIVKDGAGTLRVSGENTFAGNGTTVSGTTFNLGTLEIGNNKAFGTYSASSATAGLITVTDTNGGTLKHFVVDGNYTVANRFDVIGNAGGGGLSIDIANDTTYTMNGYTTAATGGAINVQAGTTQLTFGATTGSLTLSGNTAGTGGGGLYTAATGSLTFTPMTTFSGNTATTGSGGGLYAGDLALGNSVTFSRTATITGNKALAGSGGGLYTNRAVTFNNGLALTNNTATAGGGGILADGNVTITHNTGNTTSLVNNDTSGGNGGAISSSGNVTLVNNVATNLMIQNNDATAAGSRGGAIYATGDVTLGRSTLSTNTATAGSGGAVYSEGTVAITTQGAAAITANKAIDGGAVSAKNITLNTTAATTVTNNAATGKGGAFHIQDAANAAAGGTLTLTPAAGNLTFSGNTATGGGQAAYIGDYGKVAVNVAGATQVVQFDDTLVSDTATNHTLTKSGLGTLAFTGSGNDNIFRGTTDVNAGTFRIATGTSYGSNVGGANVFTLAGDTTNTIGLAGGGTLTADTFDLYGIVAPDKAAALTIAAADKIGSLRFKGGTAGNNTLVTMYGDNSPLSYQYDVDLNAPTLNDDAWKTTGQSDTLFVEGTFNAVTNAGEKIVINLHNFGLGKYLLIEATTLNVNGAYAAGDVNGVTGSGAFDITVHDFYRTDRHSIQLLRGDELLYSPEGTDSVRVSDDYATDQTKARNQLWLGSQYNNLKMYWTGITDGTPGAANVWQTTVNEQNGVWLDKLTDVPSSKYAETHVEDRDAVVFQDGVIFGVTPTNKAIALGSNVKVTEMIVDTGIGYSFSGAYGITTDSDYAGDKLTYGHNSAPQTLAKQSVGTLEFTNTGVNHFAGGIFFETKGGAANAGTIKFNTANQLGGANNTRITFNESGTLQVDAAIPSLTNNLRIASGKTATFDTNGYNVTLSGKIDESSGAGNFTKTGTGTLRLSSATGNDWTGSTTISNGTLQAVGVATLGPAQNASFATRTITNNATLDVEIASGSETLSQIITETGAVIKSGNGTLRFDQVNTYTGDTTITGTGTLIAQGIAALGTDAAGKQVSSTTGGTLNLELASNETLLQLLTGTTGTGLNVRKSGTGTLTINRANDYIGTTNIDAGKVVITNVGGLGQNTTTRTVTAASGTELEIQLAAAGTFNKKLSGAGKLSKTGNGVLTLSNANDFTGGATLSAGGLTLTNASALGAYNAGIASSGRIAVTGTGTTTTLSATGTPTYRNHFDVGGGLAWTLNATTTGTVGGFTNAGNGGAITLNNNAAATINVSTGQTLTFANNNIDTAGANDIFMGIGSALNVNGLGNTLIGSGIRGAGTVAKSGSGLLQIGANSVFTGQTNVTAGTFRVLGGVAYGSSTATGFSQTGGTVTGSGTIQAADTVAATISLNSTVSPDSAAGTTPTTTGADRFGTLTLDGTVNLGTGFRFNYDADTTKALTSGAVTDTFTGTTGDLIKMQGGTSYIITNNATINFQNSLSTGKYLIFQADEDFTLVGGTGKLDGIHAGGVLKSMGTSVVDASPRGMYEFIWGTDGTNDIESQVWIDVSRNSLTMTWDQAAGDYTWGETAGWLSTQTRGAGNTRETIYNDGDLVNINAPGATTLDLAANRLVAGLNVGGANSLTIGGTGFGITAKTSEAGVIEGEYLPAAQGGISTPTMTPTGKLEKTGIGSLVFTNTGGNIFEEGIFTGGGMIAFNRADQLRTWKTAAATDDRGINFTASGTLRADATGMNLVNKINLGAGTATVDTQANALTLSGLVSGTGALTKTGTGAATDRLSLTNTGNTYSGTTTVSSGTLHALSNAAGTALGQNTATHQVVISSGAELELEVASGVTATLNQTITGTGGKLEKVGAGEQILAHNNNTYSGGTTVTAGTLTGHYVGSFDSGAIVNNAALKYDMHAAGTATNLISGAGTFTKAQTGGSFDLTLNNTANTFSGNITVSDGILTGVTNRLIANDSRSLGAIGNTSRTITLVDAEDFLRINETTTTNNIANIITGAGRLEKYGAGTTTLSGTNTFTGGTELVAGGLTLSNVSALGTYTVAGSLKGQVDVTGTGTKTISLATATGTSFDNRFNVIGGTFVLTNASGLHHTIDITAAGGTNGGAVALASGTAMNLANVGSITFNGNNDNIGTNDIYMAGTAALNLTGTGNAFFNGGIRGVNASIVNKSGSGITQINADSNFMGTTTLSGGQFHVVTGKSYGNGASTFTQNGGTLSGGGNIYAEEQVYKGTISPDSAEYTVTSTAPTTANKIGTLNMYVHSQNGDTIEFDGFTMLYDPGTAAAAISSSVVSTGDLLKIHDLDSGTAPTDTVLLKGGTIRFNADTLDSGYYLIVDSDVTIDLVGTNKLDGINDGGVLGANLNGMSLATLSPRAYYNFQFADKGTVQDAQIWLGVDVNSLTMDWDKSGNGFAWNTSDANWESLQTNGGNHETRFRNGDYVRFNPAANSSIAIDPGTRVVSGMTVGSSSNTDLTFTGAGGIHSRLARSSGETEIVGKYLPASAGAERLIPDGKLTKSGSGILTFANGSDTVGNMFEEGIEIKAGTVAFNRANQLGTGVNGITFDGNAAANARLRADASAVLTNNVTVKAGQVGRINPQTHALTFNTGTVKIENGGTLHLVGSGNQFFNKGIQANVTSATLAKSGSGIVQIGDDSAFNGTTSVTDGIFRVVNGKTYGGTGTFGLSQDKTLAGNGKIKADTITISGIISPDAKVFTAADTTDPTGEARFATLTLEGATTLGGDFLFQYDARHPNNSISPTGDLLVVNGGLLSIAQGGTINLRNTEGALTGSYHIIDADRAIALGGTDINDTLSATINDQHLQNFSIRGGYAFEMRDMNKEVWLNVTHNSLNMVWQDNASHTTWTASGNDGYWLSKQGGANPLQSKETVFNNGDYVHFTGSGQNITIGGQVDIAGFEFNSTGNYTFTGGADAKIHAASNLPSTEGQFKGVSLIPDGKLNKKGSGVLAFQNQGGNIFAQGIEITAGTVAFTQANQLGDGGNGITFLGNGTLRADANIPSLTNNVKLSNLVTATFNSNGFNMAIDGMIDEISGTGNVEKTGLGTVRLANAANAWDGMTTVKSGTLQAVGAETLGTNVASRTVTVESGAELELEINGAATPAETLAQKITGAGSVEKTGTKTLVLANDNDYTGGTTVTGGRLVAETLDSAGSNVAASHVTIGNGANFELKLDAGEGGTFNQRMTGAGKFVKSGTDTVTLNRTDNNYTGNTEVTGGSVRITNVGAVGDNTATGASAHEVFLNGTNTSLELALAGNSTFNQKITGTGRLLKTGTTAATLTNANTFTGGTELRAGTLVLHDAQALNKTEAVAGSNRGFVFVTGNATVSAGNGVTAVQNRFEVSPNMRLTIDPFDIVGNDVRGVNGGAIELKSGASFIGSEPLNLTNNKTDGNGGAIYAPLAHITYGGTGLNTIASLTGNSAVDGGGVYAKSVSVLGQTGGSVISGNKASGQGGAFYLVGGATSTLDSTLGSITFQGNTSSAGANAIHMNDNATLNIQATYDKFTVQNINLNDGITSKAGEANGNVINIDLPYWTDGNRVDMLESGLYVNSVSDYYGNTNFNSGLMILGGGSRFGTIASDNVFAQYSNATLAGSGTVSAKDIQLGGTINAGIYFPPPRDADIDTLNFTGTTNIGDLSVGQTQMNIDINASLSQTADLMNITGNLKIAGNTLVDFDTFSVGKYLVVKTSNGVGGYTPGGLFDGERIITDFESTIAGYALNPNRFEITYTLENGDKDIYVNMTLHNEYLIWTGANAYVQPFSDEVSYVGHDEYRNDWLNERLYNWHEEKGGVNRDTRFRQGDKVAFIGNDAIETAQPDYLVRRENIEIVTFNNDNDTTSGVSVAHVADMIVTSGGTYRFTGRGIEASIDPFLPFDEEGAGQLFVNGKATAIFANTTNNFQRGIVLQNGSVAFNNVDQLGTIFVDDPYNGGKTSSHGITVEGNNSYGTLIANADNMELGIVISIEEETGEMVVDTGGNGFGDSGAVGEHTLTLKHAAVDGHAKVDRNDPNPNPEPVNGIYGKGRLVKTGVGTLILADENYYEGGTVVENGTLAVAADNRLGKAGVGVLLGNLNSGADATSGTLRAMETFNTNRSIILSQNGGAVEVDANKTLTHSGLLTDLDTNDGIGDLGKTGKGTFVATNTANNFQGDLNVEEGRFVAVGLGTLGQDIASRTLNTVNNGGERSILELQVANEQTLKQQLGGNGEVRKTSAGQLNLAVDSPNFAGFLNVAAGSVHLTGNFDQGDSFRFQNGTKLTGYGTLGANGSGGGIFESGSILAPGNVVANDPNVNPTSRPINVTGSVTFDSGSIYQVVITQHPDPTFDPANPDRMRPVSDCLNVKDGTVTINNGAILNVELDYWADELISFDFGEDTSGYWTIIDAGENGSANSQTEHFNLSEVELPRGVEMDHGWNGSLYQLWLIGNPTGAFTEIADSHNTTEVGTVLEELVTNKDPGMKELIKILSQKDLEDATVVDIMRQMAGDLRADSMAMALKMPWRQPFNRLDRDMFPYVPDPCEPVTCRKIHEHYKREFWGEAYGRYTDTHSDGNAFSNKISRAGTVIGVDKQINMYSLFGLALNYSEPRMTQRTGRVELEDVEIGLYNMTKISGDYDLKTYLGYSHQRYDFRRQVYIPAGNRYDALLETFKNKTSGDGFAMSVELLRSFRYNDYVKISPLVAVDYEKVWQRGYTETPADGSTALTALRYDNSSLERFMMRVGLNVKAEVRDLLDLFGRIQYATQLNSIQYARSNTYFAAATDPSVMDIHGVNHGRDYLNVGIGAEYYFKGRKRATSVYLNYDADIWKRQTTHTGNLGFVHRW